MAEVETETGAFSFIITTISSLRGKQDNKVCLYHLSLFLKTKFFIALHLGVYSHLSLGVELMG